MSCFADEPQRLSESYCRPFLLLYVNRQWLLQYVIVDCCFSDYVCLNVEVVDACIDADYCFISFLLFAVKPRLADIEVN